MMNYEVFKEEVKGSLKEHFQKIGCEDMKIEIRKVEKVNCTKDGMEFCFPSIGNVSPVLYISDLYKEYESHDNYSQIIDKIVKNIENAIGEVEQSVSDGKMLLDDRNKMQHNLVFQLINTEWNKKLLEKHPHRDFLNLSIVYRMVVKIDEGDVQSILVTNNMAEKYDFTEDELFECAFRNTQRIFPFEIINMRTLLSEQLGISHEEPSEEMPMWVITNRNRLYGAANIMYYSIIESAADLVDDDLYLLPSSLHEWIVIPVEKHELEKLIDMVKDINRNCVDVEDRLSDQVYFYNRSEKSLTVACTEE